MALFKMTTEKDCGGVPALKLREVVYVVADNEREAMDAIEDCVVMFEKLADDVILPEYDQGEIL